MKDRKDNNARQWYIRRGQEAQGPFPVGQISRYILLGRIQASDELSTDAQNWKALSELPELIPGILRADMDDPVARQQLMAAKRWANERGGGERRRRTGHVQNNRRSHQVERRGREPPSEIHRRAARSFHRPAQEGRYRTVSVAIATGVLIAISSIVVLHQPVPTPDRIDCNAPPGEAINWSNCHMEGAVLSGVNLTGADMQNMGLTGANLQRSRMSGVNLSYADLSLANLRDTDLRGATLVGASLRNADLSRADLKGADLTYANLSQANLSGTRFADVRLDNATWVDGRSCQRGSVGHCITLLLSGD